MLLSTATPDELRHLLGMTREPSVGLMADALMILCKRVSELQAEVAGLKEQLATKA